MLFVNQFRTQPARVEAVAGAGTDSKGTSETPNVDVSDAVTGDFVP
ncbi:hypothetical protein PF005_g22743 [Phytophthora fragariae]|uniref:Uncharacterized protein n=1 Tax=Phytophthora fragariae TaxID=53985 RepID=A0A6A3WAQ7_9STRA|nr:hypothetical protein PF005_g22743 [Phytophthora fragariae]